MNRSEPDIGEFENKSATYLDDDEIPETLIEVLKHFATDFIPESMAAYECVSNWLEENKDLPAGTEVSREVGKCKFKVNGVEIDAVAQPFRFYLMKRLHGQFDSLSAKGQQEVRELLKNCQMDEVLDMRLSREIGRADNLEVWL
jgi:hypothetical protein